MPLISGLLFGIGLAMSEMVNRDRILGFLDVTGSWDPTLLYVMAGALGTTFLTFQILLRRRPFLRSQFAATDRAGVNRPLVIGATLFGIGWGLSGYCPGPGVALLAIDLTTAAYFLLGTIGGSALFWTFIGCTKPYTPTSCG